jgi:hypothetical protein
MSKIIIILVLFLILVGGVVFYQLSQASQMMKTNGKVTINNQLFNVEVVKSDKDRQIGLTKYKAIKDNQGMLFVFDNPDLVSFWMKNMKFPIDIIFIKDDTIVSIVENVPMPTPNTETTTYKPDAPVNYVLEINDGLVKKHNIKKGDIVKIEL